MNRPKFDRVRNNVSESQRDACADNQSFQQSEHSCCCGRQLEPEPYPDEPDRSAVSGVGPDGTEIDEQPAASFALATVKITNGAKIEFTAVEEEDGKHGVGIRELGDAERQMPSVLAIMRQKNALKIYSTLCPGGPVPRVIAAISDKPCNADLIDTIDEPIEADLDELGIKTNPQLGSSPSDGGFGGQFCISGEGWYSFRDFTCFGAYPGNTWKWCDQSASYFWRDRWTVGHKRKNSLGITATCNGPAETRHYRKKTVGGWKRMKTWYLPSNYWQWTRYEGNFNYDRWVQHRSAIQGSPSYVRSFTAIYT